MRLYIAGPMRHIDQFNFPAFDRAAAHLRALGYEVVSPAEMDRADLPDFDETKNDLSNFDVAHALRRDFRVILEQDGIVLLPGWEASTGARAERFVAETTGRWVVTYNPDSERYPLAPFPGPWSISDPQPELDLLRHGYAWNPREALWFDEEVRPTTKAEAVARLFKGSGYHEVRVTDPTTGGQKGQKDIQLSMVPTEFEAEFGRVYAKGAEKYDRDNWTKGYAWSLSYDAMRRHLRLWWGGEELDDETGLSHLAHAAWHCATLFTFLDEGLGTDDRRKT